MGRRKARKISQRDAIRLFYGIDRGAGIVANRTSATIRTRFNFAVSRDIVPVSDPWPRTTPDRVLAADGIRALWHGLKGAKRLADGTKPALKLQRPGWWARLGRSMI